MIALLNAWGESWAGYFGLALIQHTLFLGLIFLCLHLLRNARAELRYGLCLIGMVKLLLPPFLPSGFLAVSGLFSPAGGVNQIQQGYATLLPAATMSGTGTESRLIQAPQLSLTGVLFAVWILAVFFRIAAAAVSYLRLRRELRDAVPVTDWSAGRACDGRTGGHSEVPILKSAAIPVALTFGTLHPKIYVPVAWDEWSQEFRSMVTGHEAAHLRARDRLGRIIQILVKTLYFFHPLVWILDRKMDGYREMMCDDAVTGESPERVEDYSRCLVTIAEGLMHGHVSSSSATAFLRHKGRLMERVRYQMEVGRMRSMSARKRILVFAGLLILVLPLSWYCADAETQQAESAGKAARTNITAEGKPSGEMEKVELVIFSGGEARLDGKKVAFDNLADELDRRFPSDRDRVVIRLSCGADVPMNMVSETHETLVDLNLLKVIYEDGPGDGSEEGLPLVLPTPELQKKLETIAEKHAMDVRVNLPGFVDVDGERIKITALKEAVKERLAEDPHMVVSLSWAPAAGYDDFVLALAQAKAGGAQRIAVQIGN